MKGARDDDTRRAATATLSVPVQVVGSKVKLGTNYLRELRQVSWDTIETGWIGKSWPVFVRRRRSRASKKYERRATVARRDTRSWTPARS